MVLNELRRKLKQSLKQDSINNESNDGMDISLCLYDTETKMLQFAGAYNPLLIIRNNQIIEYSADRMPVGVHPKDSNDFTNHLIQLEVNDMLYLFSDGYFSQFGGLEGKRFTIKKFKQLLLEVSNHQISLQEEVLENNLTKWKDGSEQIDDILIIGIRII